MDFYESLTKPCPEEVGARIELLAMPDDPDPIPAGTRGTVTGGNGAQMYVDWDNGRTLILAVGADKYRRVYETETGKALDDDGLDALADEAERGYCAETVVVNGTPQMCGRPLDSRGACPNPRGHDDG